MEQIKISLEAARVNARLTQEQAANKLGVSKNTVINWEKGRVAPRVSEMDRLSKLYKIPVDFIFLPCSSTKSRGDS